MLKLNVYKVSILARRSEGSSEGHYLVEHEPFLIPAESMQAARGEAESIAFERWRKEDGWHDHEAYVAETTQSDHTAITGIEQRGPIIRRSDEDAEPKTFKFS